MSRLLYIKASPRGDRSHSVAAANAFVEAYRAENPDDDIVEIDLFEADLPSFDGEAMNAKYAILNGRNHTEAERDAWSRIERTIGIFTSADKYVFAVPMWNFGIPYRLKHYIDVIVQPGYTFSFSPEEGYKGLVTGKPGFIAYARGGEYAPGTDAEAVDFQTRYLEHELGFIGFSDIRKVVIEPTLAGGPDVASQKREEAIQAARQAAKGF